MVLSPPAARLFNKIPFPVNVWSVLCIPWLKHDKKINPVDALSVNKRYIGLINRFGIFDWLFENIKITIKDDNIIQNIKAICAGDVNCSYAKWIILLYMIKIVSKKYSAW